MLALHEIGITDFESEIDHSKIKTVRDLTESFVENVDDSKNQYEDVLKATKITDQSDKELIRKLLSKISNTTDHIEIVNSWKFFELFNEERKIDENAKTPLDVLSSISLEKMSYQKGEKDLVVMRHIFDIQVNDETQTLHSTLVATGDREGSDGFSIMAQTVGFTAAIATNLVLDDKVKETGVIMPNKEEVYGPILAELEENGIKVVEQYQ